MQVVCLKRPLPLGDLEVAVIYCPHKDEKTQPLISSPKGTISMIKNTERKKEEK
jgi:hypothetical protein